jgi:hypothetical protein
MRSSRAATAAVQYHPARSVWLTPAGAGSISSIRPWSMKEWNCRTAHAQLLYCKYSNSDSTNFLTHQVPTCIDPPSMVTVTPRYLRSPLVPRRGNMRLLRIPCWHTPHSHRSAAVDAEGARRRPLFPGYALPGVPMYFSSLQFERALVETRRG